MKDVLSLAWVLPSSVLLFAACGSDDETGPAQVSNIMDPVALCNEMTKLECHKIYSCTTKQLRDLAMLPATEADCVSQLAQVVQCSQATPTQVCAGPSSYTLKQGNTCIDQVNAATCDHVNENGTNVQNYVPACGNCVPF